MTANDQETTGIYPRESLGLASEADDGGARLLVLAGAQPGTTYRLAGDALIGRAKEADIRFDGDDVSRCHAHLKFDESIGRYVISDLESANGTRVNGTRIDERVLKYGDRIELGVTTILLFTHYSRLEQRALESQKLESVGQLAGGVAHDFNNLLTIVRTNLRYLEERLEDAPLRTDLLRESLADAESATERAIDLTAQLVGFARGGKYLPEPVNLAKIVDESVRLFRRTFDATVAIVVDVPEDLEILGDRSQIMQVLMNLGLNARDAMPDGGRLEIHGRRHSTERQAGSRAGAYAMLEFRDNGMGMDEETLGKVFEPFFTTKAQGKGTGLGLATAYGIVKNHGGTIEAESTLGEGTTFRLCLPRLRTAVETSESHARASSRAPTRPDAPALQHPHEADRSSEEDESRSKQSDWVRSSSEYSVSERSGAPDTYIEDRSWSSSSDSGSRRRKSAGVVLLVDDEDAVRQSCARILALYGFRVLHAGDGVQAVETFRGNKRKIDVVVLDMVMPKMGGVETFHALREINPKVRVVLTSGYTEARGVDALLDAGATGFMRKPFDPEELLDRVEKAISTA